ncbi:hypothetical protein N7462_000075 [Penicillium macrosclerotiorum]|uniref:uncharacterized protein n=1 Tax=Penicillium macrosclerotiorum TaxID=303699 RepID=UPI002549BD43|nr:uncharacterized protein N7462_000075 [Penicillium macrosclerotiorum]KAJ5698070.1 hypothetical protein N7462_000075 [Penicillium macrosclerotiorum]
MTVSIPPLQQAAVVQNPGDDFTVVLREDIPVATPGIDEILIKLNCTGICHSETRAVLGWGAYNSIIGHEGVGTVVQAGTNVPSSLMGQRVGFKWLYKACTECSVCRRGFFQNCPNQLNTSRHVPGTLQQYAIADARFITRIPDGVPDEVAAPLLCAGLTMAGALAHLDKELQPGDFLVISGSGGGLGHIGVQIAARVKRLRVIAVDTGEDKRALSLSSGAEAFVDFRTEDVAQRVLDITAEGAHATIVVPGTKEAFQMAPRLVRNMGHIICVGLPRNDIELPISATLCAARGLTIKGSSVGSEKQMEELLQLALDGVITPAIEVFEFSETSNLIQRITNDAILGRAVVKIPQQQ